MTTTGSWTPEGFDEWRLHFPATPFARAPAHLDWTDQFIRSWQAPDLRLPKMTLVVLVAGVFSEFRLRCFHACANSLRERGYEVLRMPVSTSRGVIAQGRHMAKVLRNRLNHGQRFVVLAHSKGGIDTLASLSESPALVDACDGVALVQPPVGPSPITDGLLGFGPVHPPGGKRFDRLMRAVVGTPWLADGIQDISRRRDPRVAALLDNLPPTLHRLHAVSWSVLPQLRSDAHHDRLNALRPGCAHDGQFYIEHQVLAGMPQVCLPHLDHGQPILGGGGFAPVRFWLTLLELLHRSHSAQGTQTK